MSHPPTATPPDTADDDMRHLPIPFREFIALLALLMSLTAMSIDIMLPALPDIGQTLSVALPADLPLVVSVFMLGAAAGQLLWGPLADRIGRRPTLLAGVSLFVAATVVAVTAGTFKELLAARFVQGIGGSVGRIIVTTIVRDLFVGRQMARVMSTVMMVFILVPILAPSVGQLVLLVGNWRWIFAVLLAAGTFAIVWAAVRLPETQQPLAPGGRRYSILEAARLVIMNRVTRGYTIAAGFVFGMLVAYITSAQQVFGQAYELGRLFPLAFGSVACAIAAASFTNARLVRKLGMRRLSHTALVAFLALSSLMAIIAATVGLGLWPALAGMGLCFFLYGLMLTNFSAIGMQPMGAAAGMAASLNGTYSMTVGALLGTLIARAFDGTVLPLFASFAALAIGALLAVLVTEGGAGMFKGE